jgi:subtilisin family serine protease
MKRRKWTMMAATAAVCAPLCGLAWLSAPPAAAGGAKDEGNVVADAKSSPLFREDALGTLEKIQHKKPLYDLPVEDLFIARGPDMPSMYLVLHVEFDSPKACQDFKLDGAYPITRIDRFADLFIDKKETLLALEKSPDVRWIDIDTAVQIPPPNAPELAKERQRAEAEPIVRGGEDGVAQTGKGVIIAVLDSGLDFHHPDFTTTDGEGRTVSRLLYFWDTLSEATSRIEPPVRYPNGRPIGAMYNRDDLTAALRGETNIPVWDNNGHGTACASVAAGNGRAAKGDLRKNHVGVGVAPEADLIAVRIGGASHRIDNGYLLGAICEWVARKAKEAHEPYVITCSWGNSAFGGHDGESVEERQLDARFPLEGEGSKGRAICFAAGNAGHWRMHAAAQCGSGEKAKLLYTSSRSVLLSVYFDTMNPQDVRIEGVDPKNVVTYVNRLTWTVVSDVALPAAQTFGGDKVLLSCPSGAALKADAYLRSGDYRNTYFAAGVTRTKQLDDPGSAANAITVGSYDWNSKFPRRGEFIDYLDVFGDPIKPRKLSGYSSHGPNRAGVIKPDVVAPGQWFTAAAPSNVDLYRDGSGMYLMHNGTSAATPYTAGVVALMLQKDPELTLGRIKDLLHTHAKQSADADTGDLPNPEWGYGRLDRKAVLAVLEAIR